VTESSDEPEPRPQTREAWRLERAVLDAVNDGDPEEALARFAEFEAFAKAHPWCGVVAAWLTALAALGELAGPGVPDIATLARRIAELSEPWFAADADGFREVIESRHAAFHRLMYAAAEAGDLDLALAMRRADDAGNARANERAIADGPPAYPPAIRYPSAYGNKQMIDFLVDAGRFAEVPELLANLQALTNLSTVPTITDVEDADAFGDEESAALVRVLLSDGAPDDLRAACRARIAMLDALAVPFADWPRTREKLAPAVPSAVVQ
jgi:hypothetical protein